MVVYLISGLGADKRAFQKLRFPEGYQLKYLDWIEPEGKETLEEYAGRFAKLIGDTQPFILVGLSMGGMISLELSRIVKPKLAVIISSITSAKQLPWYYRVAGILQLDRLTPSSVFNTTSHLGFYMIGAADPESKMVLSDIVKDSDPKFVRWALRSILNWKAKDYAVDIFQIHGTLDRVLPIRFTKPNAVVEAGGHFMIYTKADQISELISSRIKQLTT